MNRFGILSLVFPSHAKIPISLATGTDSDVRSPGSIGGGLLVGTSHWEPVFKEVREFTH